MAMLVLYIYFVIVCWLFRIWALKFVIVTVEYCSHLFPMFCLMSALQFLYLCSLLSVLLIYFLFFCLSLINFSEPWSARLDLPKCQQCHGPGFSCRISHCRKMVNVIRFQLSNDTFSLYNPKVYSRLMNIM